MVRFWVKRRSDSVFLRRRRRFRLRWFLLGGLLLFCLPAMLLLPLRWVNPPVTSYMLQSPVQPVRQVWVAPQDLGPFLPRAAIAAEDQKFVRHLGFDVASIAQAWENREQRRRGASTISQQTAKNLFLWPGGYFRKVIEAWITLWLELLWSKERILEVYLNIAEFGPGLYGAEVAARHYFGVSAAGLSARQAAQLIAVLPNPRDLRAEPAGPYVRERADWILQQMPALEVPELSMPHRVPGQRPHSTGFAPNRHRMVGAGPGLPARRQELQDNAEQPALCRAHSGRRAA